MLLITVLLLRNNSPTSKSFSSVEVQIQHTVHVGRGAGDTVVVCVQPPPLPYLPCHLFLFPLSFPSPLSLLSPSPSPSLLSPPLLLSSLLPFSPPTPTTTPTTQRLLLFLCLWYIGAGVCEACPVLEEGVGPQMRTQQCRDGRSSILRRLIRISSATRGSSRAPTGSFSWVSRGRLCCIPHT